MWLEVDIRQAFWIKSPPSHAGWVASHEIPETSNYLILGYVGVIVEKEETLQKAQRTRELSSSSSKEAECKVRLIKSLKKKTVDQRQEKRRI